MIVHWLIAHFVPKQFMSSLIPSKTLIAEALQSAVIHFYCYQSDLLTVNRTWFLLEFEQITGDMFCT